MSLLSIIQGACGQLGVVQPSSVITSADLQTQKMLEFVRMEGKELARRFDWQILMREGAFTTVAAETQVASVTTTFADFGRIAEGTMWNRTQGRPVRGPLTAQQWQRRKAAFAQVGVEFHWRLRGGVLMFNPLPPASDSIYFEYLSNKWCQSSSGTAQADWAADTDTSLIDEEVVRLGLVWRFLQSKGLDYDEEFRTYEQALVDIFGPDAGNQVVDMGGETVGDGVNLPDGNWSL